MSSGLLDGKHCSLPHLTGKTFVFNAAAERLDLCVDAAGHFPVSPEVEEQVKEALLQLQVRSEASGGSRESRESSEASGVLRLGGGGVVRKKETFQSLNAFQGRGHSLGNSSGLKGPLLYCSSSIYYRSQIYTKSTHIYSSRSTDTRV